MNRSWEIGEDHPRNIEASLTVEQHYRKDLDKFGALRTPNAKGANLLYCYRTGWRDTFVQEYNADIGGGCCCR